MAMLIQPRPKPMFQTVLREPPPAAPQVTGGRTPREVERDRQIAMELAKSAGDTSPIQHWTQGLGRIADGVMGALTDYRAREAEEAGRAGFRTKLEGYQKSLGDPSMSKADQMAQMLALVDDPWASEGARSLVNAQMAAMAPKQAPGDVQEYEYAKAQGYPGTFFDYQKELGATRASQINLGGGTDKQIFDEMKASADAARSAVTGLRSLSEAKRALQGGGYFGSFADQRLAFAKLAALMGAGDTSKITNTETFRSAIAPQVAALMKATVGSTQISNADREFAEKAAGGSIQLDERTIARLVDVMERAGQVVVSGHNTRLDQVYPDGKTFGRERALFGVQAPAPQADMETPIANTTPVFGAEPNGTAPQVLPLPKDPAMFQPGKTYRTSDGKARPFVRMNEQGKPVFGAAVE